MHRPVLRFLYRLFVWLGIAAVSGIQAGDRIRIATARGAYEYVVESTSVVDPGDNRVTESRGRQELTLITSSPFSFAGAAPRQFVVHARLLTATARDL